MKEISAILQELEQRVYPGAGLTHLQPYLDSIDNPQFKLTCVHIAGTNGKGSTTNYLSEILQASGYRVGTFTSPYLISYFDRICVNHKPIDAFSFQRIYLTHIEDWNKYQLSKFEIDTVISFFYFLEQKCDICIFETGLGGLHDSTNAIASILSIITNIGFDHMEILGDTYEKITIQKAGIIKNNTACISAEQKEECRNILIETCKKKNSTWIEVQLPKTISIQENGILFSYQSFQNLHIQSTASYQVSNACCAIEASLFLNRYGFKHIQKNSIYTGLHKAMWKGRFEYICKDPIIILDGAHNVDGIQALVKALAIYPNYRILFSAVKDKEYTKMLTILSQHCKDIVITGFNFHRAQDPYKLGENLAATIIPKMEDAISYSLEDNSLPLVICGSLYFISQVRKYLLHTLPNTLNKE